ncbi:MAG: hypothetical protein LBL33_06595 [Tannerella sp.]|jgi:hypothetical protein|nr:hypothetical protein [Tannerella sp.]
MKTFNRKLVIFGILGTIAAFLIIIADIAGGIGEYNGVFWEQFAGMTPVRLLLSSHMAIYVFPFITFGIITIYKVLEPSGKIISATFGFCLWYLTYLMTAAHAGYPYISYLTDYNQLIGNPQINEVLDKFSHNIGLHLIILYVLAFIASLGIFVLIIAGKTMLKRWMSLCNPIVTIALSVIVGMVSPVLGKHYGTCCPMVGLFLLLLCSTITIARNTKIDR